jgi:hypothetical protein
VRRLATAFAVFLIAGCSPATHTIAGTISFPGFKVDQWCRGSTQHGTSDLQLGMQVTVVDESGKTIAAGLMTNTAMVPGSNAPGSIQGMCSGEFSIEQVPDAGFYLVLFGTHKTKQYSKADLEGSGWKLDLKIN